MLASMIDLAKVEAEDELRTKALAHQRLSEFEKRASQADATIYSHLDTSQVRFEAKRKDRVAYWLLWPEAPPADVICTGSPRRPR